jgi:O-antigen/teichoic acid export membrane protein
MIDAYWISLTVVMIGALARTALPYIMKCIEEKDTKFQMSYLYGLIIPAIFGAVALIPIEIAPSPQYYVGLFCAGLGVQSVVADGIKKREKKKKAVN